MIDVLRVERFRILPLYISALGSAFYQLNEYQALIGNYLPLQRTNWLNHFIVENVLCEHMINYKLTILTLNNIEIDRKD